MALTTRAEPAPSGTVLTPQPAAVPHAALPVLERIAAFAMRLLEVPVAALTLSDGTRVLGGAAPEWQGRMEVPLARTLCQLAVASGRPVLIGDARTDPRVLENPMLWLGEVAYAAVPVRDGSGMVAGCLSALDERPREWTEGEVQTLSQLASFAEMALGAARGAGGDARRARRGRRVSLRMLEKAVETMQLGVTITDVRGHIIYANPADARMHGYEMDELVGQHAGIFAPPQLARPLHPDGLSGVTSWSRETVNVRRDGSEFPVLLRSDVVEDGHGRAVGVVTCCEDVSHRRHLERQLLRSAFYDPLTGLPNRELLSHRLERAVERARRGDGHFSVLAVGVDSHKLVSDSLGPQSADDLLAAVGSRLQDRMRGDTMVARLGHDEFGILLDRVDGVLDAARVAERVQAAMAEAFTVRGREVFSTASLGIAHSATGYEAAADAIRDALIAMYRSREAAKGHYEVFDQAMHARAMARLRMETDLRRALDRDELRVHYQAIVMLETGRISGFEALVRWQHPELGLIQPDDFIPLAEETGLILPIGMWVLREACAQLCRLGEADCGEVSVAVNLSVKQLVQGDLPERVAGVLEEFGVQPHRLKLEITESVIMQHSEAITSVLHRLKALGLQLHIDDFGTGYSSLGYLHRLPLDALKIDRSFLSGADGGPNLQLVRGIVALAHALDVAVVTEGIESAELLTELRSLRCEYGQGFFFSRPLEGTDAELLCRNAPIW
jgi:Amt family ammonium transporter